jgi:hypothetical protein
VGGPPPASSPRARGLRPLKRRVGGLAPLGAAARSPRHLQQAPRRQPAFPQDSGSTAPTTPGTRASQTLSKSAFGWSCWTRPGRDQSPETWFDEGTTGQSKCCQPSMQTSFPRKRPKLRKAQQGGRVEDPPQSHRPRRWGGSRCLTGKPRSNNGVTPPARRTTRASWTGPSSSGRNRPRRWNILATGSRGDRANPFPKGDCSTSGNSSPQWPRVGGTGGQPIMRTMHKGRASCPSGRIDAMGHGRISTRRSDMASFVT